MEFKHERGNILILFDKITQIPLLIAAVLLSLLKAKDFELQVLLPILFLALSPLVGIARYVSTYYTIEKELLIVETGIFNKKRLEIPLSKITTVDLSQNILYQLFKTYKIKADNGSQAGGTAEKAEIVLALKADKAFEFKRVLTQDTAPQISQEENADETTALSASFQDFIILGLLQSKIAYFFAGGSIALPVISAIAVLATGSKDLDALLDKVFEQIPSATAIFAVAAFFYFIALGISIIRALFTYYHFRISADADAVKVEYGLLNKKKFTLQKRKISGILLKQNLLMRAFKCYTVEVSVMGYGHESGEEAHEQAILYPIASMEKIKRIVRELLPEFDWEHPVHGPDRKAKRYFFYRPGFILATLVFISVLFTKELILIVPAGGILAIAAIGVILQYRSAGIFCGKNNIVLSFGGYRKTIAVVKTARIESITAKGSIFKRKKGIVSIELGFIAPLGTANIAAPNLPAEQYKLLENVIRY